MTVLKSGDLVVLKSGGPIMTVDTVNTDMFDDNKVTGILCVWFVGELLQRARFEPAALDPASLPGTSVTSSDAGIQDAAGEYGVALEAMVAAMNDAVDTSKTATTERRPRKHVVRGAPVGAGRVSSAAGSAAD